MIRYFFGRLVRTLPTLIGITLATFLILNVAMEGGTSGASTAGSQTGLMSGRTGEADRMYGLHLPLFINLSIADIRTLSEQQILALEDPRERADAKKKLVSLGAAIFPHVIPMLDELPEEARGHLLDAMDTIASRMHIVVGGQTSEDKVAFWTTYWSTYGPDFTQTRASRLVKRVIRRDDSLAREELAWLDSFALPQLMEGINNTKDPEARARLIEVAGGILSIKDPLEPTAPKPVQEAVVARWNEWWHRHYDQFTVFEGTKALSGAVTETRYFRWLSRISRLDFGLSLRDSRPIIDKLRERLPVTLFLSFLALVLSYIVAVPLGIVSAVKKGSIFDKLVTVTTFVLFSIPTFWVAIILFRYSTQAAPSHFYFFSPEVTDTLATPGVIERIGGGPGGYILPVLCLAYVSIAMLIRYQRVGMIQVIGKGYMTTARAKGLSKTGAILKHGLRNGLLPIITMLGLQLPYLVSGSVVVERIFGIPGMGFETFEALRSGDHPWLIAVVTVTAALTLLGVIVSDALYAMLDPRIAPGRGRAQQV